MQYYKPDGPYFVGDCMPFYHDGVFRLYYLLDENHHTSRGWLGNHQWAQASSPDLVHWTHHGLTIPITADWEGSICTGSVFHHKGTYYAFYSTRMADASQHVSLAVSSDGVNFSKTSPNPLISPPAGYHTFSFRDPCVFRDDATGVFHMLVTSQRVGCGVPRYNGCLAHLSSADFKTWSFEEPFLFPGYCGQDPECPEHFYWNGWYYLLFGIDAMARYRMSRSPLGPWICPPVDVLEGTYARVMKTAPYRDNRRIGVAFVASREGGRDDGQLMWAGNAVFRELVQHADGTLGVKFVPEMMPIEGDPLAMRFSALTAGARGDGMAVVLDSSSAFEVAALDAVPNDARITMRVHPQVGARHFGLRLRGFGRYETGYDLSFRPVERTVELHNQSIACVEGLDRPFDLDIVMRGDIIDVCIDRRRCLVNRLGQLRGSRLFFFSHNGRVRFEGIETR